MGWFSSWRNKVDIGLRPRQVSEGTEVNLYPFTKNGYEWLEQNLDKFSDAKWSQENRCLELSDLDCLGLHTIVQSLLDAGLTVRFYGRLKGWDGELPAMLYLKRT
jgi:hypothetical protein